MVCFCSSKQMDFQQVWLPSHAESRTDAGNEGMRFQSGIAECQNGMRCTTDEKTRHNTKSPHATRTSICTLMPIPVAPIDAAKLKKVVTVAGDVTALLPWREVAEPTP